MNSTTNKEKWWIYLIFLFVGIISLFTGFFIGNVHYWMEDYSQCYFRCRFVLFYYIL